MADPTRIKDLPAAPALTDEVVPVDSASGVKKATIAQLTALSETPAGAQAKVNAHRDVAAPHAGHETPAGATAKIDAHKAAADAHSGTYVPTISDNGLVKIGTGALAARTTGVDSIAIGTDALKSATGLFDGYIAIGSRALAAAVPTIANRYYVAIGFNAAADATTGYDNVAIGGQAMRAATTAYDNVAVGCYSLRLLTTGSHNVALGESALYENVAGHENIAIGDTAGHALLSDGNIAIGEEALWRPATVEANKTTTGAHNIGIGSRCGQASAAQRNYSVILGWRGLVDGDYAIAIGASAKAGAHGSVAIGTDTFGAGASTTTENEIRLGTALHQVRLLNKLLTPVVTSDPSGDLRLQGNGVASDLLLNASDGRHVQVGKHFYPATPAHATQASCGLYAGAGAPGNADGNNGDVYFRSDGGSLTTVYQRRAGAWVGIV